MIDINNTLKHGAMIFALCVFSLYDYIPGNTYFLVFGCILSLPFLVDELVLRYDSSKLYAVVLLVCFLVGSILNLLSTNNGIGGSLVVLGTFSVGLYCIHYLNKLRWFVFLILVFNLFFIIHGLFDTNGNANEIYEESGLSRNHPGFLLILWISFYSYILKSSNKNIDIVIPIIVVVVSFFLEGRSSLAILLLISIVLLMDYNRNLSLFICVFLILLIIIYWDNIMTLYELSSFEERGTESSRMTNIWPAYFKEMSFPWLIFGVDTMSVYEIAKWAGNPHNAFLNMHARMGILAVVAFFVVLYQSTKSYIYNEKYICVFFLYAILLRLFFDSEAFISPYDYVLYCMILYPIYQQTNCYEQEYL